MGAGASPEAAAASFLGGGMPAGGLTGGGSAANAEQSVRFGDININHGSLFWPIVFGLAGLAYWAIKRKK